MNDNTDKGVHERFLQFLAIIGFVITVFLLAWLAVQLVRFIPTAFSSLASVFESNQRELNERTNNDDQNVVVINDDEEDSTPEEVFDDSASVDDIEGGTPSVEEDNEVDSAPTPTPTPTVPAPVEYKTVVTYKTPVSDPNGYTDLQASFVAVGHMTSGGRFMPTNVIEEGKYSALQFAVKNIGTKTSGEWHFGAELPGGSTMNSKVQKPLKPSETSTLTVVFTPNEDGRERASVTVFGGNDISLTNNSFDVNVEVVN